MKKYYWKVTNKDNMSALNEHLGDVGVQYKVNDWVEPKIKYTKLAVFKRKKDAIHFKVKSDLVIHKCIVKNPEPIDELLYVYSIERCMHDIEKKLQEFWKKINTAIFPTEKFWTIYAPPGTIACDAVKLLD